MMSHNHGCVSSSSRWPGGNPIERTRIMRHSQGCASKNTHLRSLTSSPRHHFIGFILVSLESGHARLCKGLHILPACNRWGSLPLKTYRYDAIYSGTDKIRFVAVSILLVSHEHEFSTLSHLAIFWKTQHIWRAWHAAPFMINDTSKGKLIYT